LPVNRDQQADFDVCGSRWKQRRDAVVLPTRLRQFRFWLSQKVVRGREPKEMIVIARAIFALLLTVAVAAHADEPKKVDTTKAGTRKTIATKLNWLPFDSVQKTFPIAPKPLFLYISEKGCDHCEYMDSEVFNRPEIARFVNENLTPVRVDIYLNTPLKVRDSLLDERTFRKLLSIEGIPAYYFFDTTGQVIGVLDSQMDLLTFKQMLVYIGQGHFFRTPWNKFILMPEALEANVNKIFELVPSGKK
jgi:thioredoxin-related protein